MGKIDIPFFIEVKDSDKKIKENINKAMREAMTQALLKIQKKVGDEFATRIVKVVFRRSPEFNAIKNGPLNAMFGLPPGSETDVLDAILNFIQDAVRVEFKRIAVRTGAGAIWSGGLNVIWEFKYRLLADLPEGSIISPKKRTRIPWLEWMLYEGNRIIIRGYQFQFTSAPGSTSKKGIMVPVKGGGWKMPTAFAGTNRNNWFTRIFDREKDFLIKSLTTIIERELAKVL